MNTHRAASARVTVPAPVRRWLYGIAAAAAPLATVYGLVTAQQSVLWLNLAGDVLFTMAVGNTPARTGEVEALGDDECRRPAMSTLTVSVVTRRVTPWPSCSTGSSRSSSACTRC